MYSEYTNTIPPSHLTMFSHMLAILLLYLPIFAGANILSTPGLYSNSIVPARASTRSFMTLLNPSSPTKIIPGFARASSTLHGNVIVSACKARRVWNPKFDPLTSVSSTIDEFSDSVSAKSASATGDGEGGGDDDDEAIVITRSVSVSVASVAISAARPAPPNKRSMHIWYNSDWMAPIGVTYTSRKFSRRGVMIAPSYCVCGYAPIAFSGE